MAHYAIVSPDEAGHLLSMGSLGKELVRRGHRVTIIGSERAAPLAKQLDLPLHQWNADDVPGSWNFPLWLAFRLAGAGQYIEARDWLRWQAEASLRLLPPALDELAVDGVLIDQVALAAGSVAEHAGVPFVTVSTALLWNEDHSVPPQFTSWPYAEGRRAMLRNRLGYAGWHWFIRPVLSVINRYRRNWNLPRFFQIDDALSPLAQISQLCEGFDFPRREHSDILHYVGSLTANRKVNTDYQFPWDRLDGRPLILASLGTVADSANVPVFRNILAACTGLDAQLVLALGQWSDQEEPVREQLGDIGSNALVVDFAPQLSLLDRAALLITHAGVNTVLEAICHGVPMVALPRLLDQCGMGARLTHAGLGLLGSFQHSTPEQIRGLVQRILADDTFRRRARALQTTMLAAGGASRAADIAEMALTTRRPVRADQSGSPIPSPHDLSFAPSVQRPS